MRLAARSQVGQRGTYDAQDVDAVVLEEPVILGRQDGLFMTSGTSLMRTTLRRSSPNSPISTPSAVKMRRGILGR